jgi:catechol 2,3-dioxygenase-like lactoylglutathione lyase family enzyme
MIGPIDPTLRKVHVSLNVSELDRSIAFYRVLLGADPAKVRKDYAKFDLAEPPLVLSLAPGRQARGGNLNHAGLRVRTAEELVEIQHRLEAGGFKTRREDGVECCYSRQTKFWIADPDGALWEIYVFHEDVDDDLDHHADESAFVQAAQIETGPAKVPRAWEHHLREPIPSRLPHEDNTLHEIRLEGVINAAPGADNRRGFVADCLRALRPGGSLFVHGLAGDTRSVSAPNLPGPAAAVAHVPSTADVVDELARAGFGDITIELLSPTAYFEVDGNPMREIRVTARKPGHRPAAATHHAIYLGPMTQVIDDYGNVFRRGVVTPLNVHDWQALSKSSAAESFLLLKPSPARALS